MTAAQVGARSHAGTASRLDATENPHAIVLLLLLFPEIIKGEQDWADLLVGIPATVLLWLLVTALVFRRKGLA
jgi:threonine/homoserine/homoserine lactone efflux protein